MSARWRHDDETGEVPPEHAPEPAAGLAAKGEPPRAAKGEPQLAATGEGLAASSAASKGASLSSWPRRDGRHDGRRLVPVRTVRRDVKLLAVARDRDGDVRLRAERAAGELYVVDPLRHPGLVRVA